MAYQVAYEVAYQVAQSNDPFVAQSGTSRGTSQGQVSFWFKEA